MIQAFRRTVAAVIATAGAALLPAQASAQVINLAQNEQNISPFGSPVTATYGQTFTTAGGFNTLNTFSFWLSSIDSYNGEGLLFRAYVMQWDAVNGHATGPVLYSSALYAGTAFASQRYDFNTGNLLLTGGAQYVAFLSASGYFASMPPDGASVSMEGTLAGTYTGGQFVFHDNGDDFSKLTTEEWALSGNAESFQTRFYAEFSGDVAVVPEPSTYLLMFSGLSAVLLVARKRKRV
ncbi:MAG: PEP-CTERM sorting domain-containing protein [Gemmatimonas sp.]